MKETGGQAMRGELFITGAHLVIVLAVIVAVCVIRLSGIEIDTPTGAILGTALGGSVSKAATVSGRGRALD